MMEEIKGWRPSFIELVLSQPVNAEEPAPPIDSDFQEILPFHDSIMEIKAEIESINKKKR